MSNETAADAGDRLRITEIFHSLQGEARSVGWPTVFVRLTGCPLRCVWCDTEYSFHGGALARDRRRSSKKLQSTERDMSA